MIDIQILIYGYCEQKIDLDLDYNLSYPIVV